MQDFMKTMKIILKKCPSPQQNPWGIKIWQNQTNEQMKKEKPNKNDDRIGIKEENVKGLRKSLEKLGKLSIVLVKLIH